VEVGFGVDVDFGVEVGLGVDVAFGVDVDCGVRVGVAVGAAAVGVAAAAVGVSVAALATSTLPSLLLAVMGSLRGSHNVALDSVRVLVPTAFPRNRIVASTPEPFAAGAGSRRVKS